MEKETKKPGRIIDYNKKLPVLEVYTCIQSEGSRQGRPTVAIRTTGCTHRCWFGAGGWCDSWYTSIHPEKGIYTFNDIIKIYDENPHIREMMLTGGSPTMQPELVNELKGKGKSLDQYLDEIGSKFGFHLTDQISVRVSEANQALTLLDKLLKNPPNNLYGFNLELIEDLFKIEEIKTRGIRMRFAGGIKVIIRPSGTEPKVKCYLEVIRPVKAESEELLSHIKEELIKLLS